MIKISLLVMLIPFTVQAKTLQIEQFKNCNEKIPTIDLEQETITPNSDIKGTLYGVPRDHQDGVGSCYANVARNMLLTASEGKIDASFLDIALQTQINQSSKPLAIDGGHPCSAINALRENGYCPQEFSPIESGDVSNTLGGIFKKNKSNIQSQARILDMLNEYLEARGNIEISTDPFLREMIKNPEITIDKIKKNHKIQLPFPRIENFPIDDLSLASLYLWSYKKPSQKRGVGEKGIVGEEEFLSDMRKANKKFLDEYSKYLLESKVFSPEKVKKLYKKHYGDVVKKYSLESRFSDKSYGPKIEVFFENDQREDFKQRNNDTNNFYNEYLRVENGLEIAKIEYDRLCGKDVSALESYGKGLSELIEFSKKNKVNPALLAHSNKEILQLAIAPKCLNEKNRQKLNLNFKCINDGRTAKKDNEYYKNLIIRTLLKGQVVANGHSGSLYGSHINSIVGYRYNTELKNCEFKIRESQTAKSEWFDSKSILSELKSVIYLEEDN